MKWTNSSKNANYCNSSGMKEVVCFNNSITIKKTEFIVKTPYFLHFQA